MYRPWWFPEWTPKEQYLFDKILQKIEEVFQKHNYEHVWTPAVENVDILKKWGDAIDQQIFGLYGLAQWPQDVKEYALHFDLTVPLARYVLDHKNDLVFPFSRYQMQPVWRGERTQRGRFKEFWQFDVDTIWPSDSDVGTWYDVQSLYVIDKTMQQLTDAFVVDIKRIAKISHLWLTKEFLSSIGANQEQSSSVLKVLDSYYKRTQDQTAWSLQEVIGAEATEKLMHVIHTKDRTLLADLPSFRVFDEICTQLDLLGVRYEYDICIVRWQNYYSGMVVEWMDPTDTGFGSLAWWGRYDGLTSFIDPKQSFSGVWASLGRFVYLMMEKITSIKKPDSYLFINFEDTKENILELYKGFLDAWLCSEFYPTSAKLAKQFAYADKKWFSHCVLLGAGEKERGMFALKNMATGETTDWKIDFSFGIIPVLQIAGEKKVLIVQQEDDGHRCFPKWHPDEKETQLETAFRECKEEVGIEEITIIPEVKFCEKYLVEIASGSRKWQRVFKNSTYFVGYVKKDSFTIDPKEIKRAVWLTIDDAQKLPLYPQMREIIENLASVLV